MLINEQVEIQAYIELMELTLLSVMSLARRNEAALDNHTNKTQSEAIASETLSNTRLDAK